MGGGNFSLGTGHVSVVSSNGDCVEPCISGDTVAWCRFDHLPNAWPFLHNVLLVKNLSGGKATSYYLGDAGEEWPAISGSLLVWDHVASLWADWAVTDIYGVHLP